jgi:hypothetical protein
MNKLLFCLLLVSVVAAQAVPLDSSKERDIREKLKMGLQTVAKDTAKKYAIHQEDLPNLRFEAVDVPILNLPTKANWDKGPKTVVGQLAFSAIKSDPQKCIFVKKDGKYIGFLTSEKSSYLDQKIGAEIQKIYDLYKPSEIIWVYYNAGSYGKWLTFSVKSMDEENLTLVDTSGTSPQGYYYQLIPFKKVIERGLGM